MALDIRQNRNGVFWVSGIKRGDVYLVSVRQKHSVGSEQNHEDATPWLVVSSDAVHARYPIAIVVPLTSKLGKMDDFRGARIVVPESQKLPGKDGAPLSGDSLVLTEQVRVIAHERIIKGPVAKLSTAAMASVEAGLKHVLDMP